MPEMPTLEILSVLKVPGITGGTRNHWRVMKSWGMGHGQDSWCCVSSLGLGGNLGGGVPSHLTDPSMLSSSLQFWLTMSYLSQMTEEQTLVMYSGHPLGLFPSTPWAPRLVITNGMVGPGAAGHGHALGQQENWVPPTPASPLFPLCRPSPWLPSLFSRSFRTTPPGQNMRSSLPWESQCKPQLTVSVFIKVFPPQPCFIFFSAMLYYKTI